MRTVVSFATLAAVVLPSIVGAQSLALTESEALARLSIDSPRVRANWSSLRKDYLSLNLLYRSGDYLSPAERALIES